MVSRCLNCMLLDPSSLRSLLLETLEEFEKRFRGSSRLCGHNVRHRTKGKKVMKSKRPMKRKLLQPATPLPSTKLEVLICAGGVWQVLWGSAWNMCGDVGEVCRIMLGDFGKVYKAHWEVNEPIKNAC